MTEPGGDKPHVVITGGSGGFGFYVLRAFLDDGWQVMNLDRYACDDDRVLNFSVDLANHEQLRTVIQRIRSSTPRVDVLVNLATAYNMQPLKNYVDDSAVARDTIVNVAAPLMLVSGLLPALNQGHYPLVVNVSSNAALGAPFCAHYVMSKAALNGLTFAINEEFRIHGRLRATTVMFGSIDAGLTSRSSIKAITAKEGVDPVISGSAAAQYVLHLAKMREFAHVPESQVFPHKENIRRARVPPVD